MKRHFFRSKFIMFISLTLVPICLFGFISMFYINSQLKNEAREKTQSTTKLMEQYMGELSSTLEFFRVSLTSDPQLHLALFKTLNNDYTSTEDLSNLIQAMQNLYYSQSTKPYIQSLFLTMKGSPYYISGITRETFKNSTDSTWAKEAEGIDTLTFIKIRNVKKNKFDTVTAPVITVYHRLRYHELMAINLRQDYFNQWLTSIADYKGQELFITDSNGQILFGSQGTSAISVHFQEKINGFLIPGNEHDFSVDGYFCNTGVFPGVYGFHYFSLIPEKELFHLSDTILKLTLAAGLLSIFLSSVLSYLYTLRDYRQIFQIIDLFDRAEKGNFKPEENVEQRKNNIYFHIINNIITLFMSRTYLKVQLDVKKYALSTAQLSALQYQLNPHFLFNTLQSIDLEILKLTKKPTAANRMIASLSELLRYSLHSPAKPVSLEEEIIATCNYIDLQNWRLGEAFQVAWKYSEDLLKFPIPRLILQPIIENSIVHCGYSSLSNLKIKIKVSTRDGYLTFVIIDNGYGMDSERQNKMALQINDNQVEESGKHIGLKNICQRVRLAYPKGYLKLWSKKGMGTIVTIGGIESHPSIPHS